MCEEGELAFYAEVYGYICQKNNDHLEEILLSNLRDEYPIFRMGFSSPVLSHGKFYISFAGQVKIDTGEESSWIGPFEKLLSGMNFLNATVNIIYEDSPQIMMYSYINDGGIQKFSSKLVEEFGE